MADQAFVQNTPNQMNNGAAPIDGQVPAGTTTAPAGAAAPAANQPWYSTMDADNVAWLESKNWKQDDPLAVLPKALESYRNAEKMIGTPPDQLIKMPKEGDSEAWG